MVWRALTKEKLDETKLEFASKGYVMQWYAMASEVILTTLGPEWWKTNCISSANKPDEFLAFDEASEDTKFDHQDRIVKLGHMLFALRESEGFEAFIAALVTRDLAPTFFELWVANILKQNEYSVEFVEAGGKKGEDYDLIARKNGIALHVEAKSRRDGVVLEEKTLRNALGKARKQLPSSGPGSVFVSIPFEWTMDKDAEKVVGKCIESFFENTSRVNYVVLICHQWIKLETGRVSASLVRQYENPRPRTPTPLGVMVRPLKLPIIVNAEAPDFQPSFW